MSNSKNEQIEHFLDYYVGLKHAPQYAVMIRGSWGSGKTWFMERQLQRFRAKEGKALYVSLYGVATVLEIEEEFFRQLHPVLASKGMALAGKVAKAFLKGALKIDLGDHGHASTNMSFGLPEIDLPDYLKNTEGMVLVFDDVERCTVPINELLGYINYFVEHDGYKAILVANEDEIYAQNPKADDSSTAYVRIREKLIGKTFEVEADLDAALHCFAEEIESTIAREQIEKNLENIRAIYKTSGYKNLRHLRQALLDFSRILSLLEGQHQKNDALASHLLAAFLVYSIEMKSGNLTASDIKTMSTTSFRSLIRSSSIDPENASDRILAKYAHLLPQQRLLPDSVWAELMSTGLVGRSEFRQAVLNSGYFPKEEATWVRLWNSSQLEDDEFEKLMDEMAAEFATSSFKEVGVLLHVTGILFAMSDLGVFAEKKEDILKRAIANVDVLRQSGDLARSNLESSIGSVGYAALGFQDRDSPEFVQLKKHVQVQMQAAREDAYPTEAHALLELIQDDPQKFARSIILSNHSDNRFYAVPILAYASSQDFVDKVAVASVSAQWTLRAAIQERYALDFSIGALAAEADWLTQTSALLARVVAQRKGKLSGDRLNYIVEAMSTGAKKLTNYSLSQSALNSTVNGAESGQGN